jgi:hypothetical protein
MSLPSEDEEAGRPNNTCESQRSEPSAATQPQQWSKAAFDFFTKEMANGKAVYRCNFCKNLYSATGASNLAQHLGRCTELEKDGASRPALPAKRVRTTKDLSAVALQTKPRTLEDFLLYQARRLHEFEDVEDPFWNAFEFGMTRKTVPVEMGKLCERWVNKFVSAGAGMRLSIGIDSGTNNDMNTVDCGIIFKEIARLWKIFSFEQNTASTIFSTLKESFAPLVHGGWQIDCFISDNAANMLSAGSQFSLAFKCFQVSCGDHTIALLVLGHITHRDDLTSYIEKCREVAPTIDVPAIPFKQDTRWNNDHDMFKVISQNWQKFFAAKVFSREVGEAMARFYTEILKPHMIWTRRLEADDANIFDLLHCYAELLPSFVQLPEKIQGRRLEYVSWDCVVVAAFLQPTVNWKLVNPFLFKHVKQVVKRTMENVGIPFCESEFKYYTEFIQQHSWASRLNSTDYLDDFWEFARTAFPKYYEVYVRLRCSPASSSFVERIFKDHARAMDGRWRLKKKNLESQLLLHSWQKAAAAEETRKPKPKQKALDVPLVKSYINCIARVWKMAQLDKLTEGLLIKTYWQKPEAANSYATRLDWDLWMATLLVVQPCGKWKVKWGKGKQTAESDQLFDPIEDDWETA